MVHYRKSWQSGGTAIIIVGVVLLGFLVLSLEQYILDKDFHSIIIMAVLGLLFIISGIAVKRWARKNGKK